MILVGVTYGFHLESKIKARQAWQQNKNQLVEDTLYKQQYREIKETLNDDDAFWYNLSAELYFRKEYLKSLSALNHAEQLNNNTDVQILKGLCYHDLNEHQLAEEHYTSAHNMCPKLFKPLYLLVKLYEQAGDTINAKKTAIQVLNKKVKVESFEIDIMKGDIKQYKN